MKQLLAFILACFCSSAAWGAAEDPVRDVPENMRPLALDARQLFEKGEFARAEKAYEKMVAQQPESVWALSNLAVVRFRQGKLAAAEKTIREALRLAPEDKYCHRTLAIILHAQGREAEAAKHFEKAGERSLPGDDSEPPVLPIPLAGLCDCDGQSFPA